MFLSPLNGRRRATICHILLCATLLSLPLKAGQFDTWQHTMKITFNYAAFERLNNFPALIILNRSIPGFSYSQFSANGQDMRFEDTNDVALAYEIETTSGHPSWAWSSLAPPSPFRIWGHKFSDRALWHSQRLRSRH